MKKLLKKTAAAVIALSMALSVGVFAPQSLAAATATAPQAVLAVDGVRSAAYGDTYFAIGDASIPGRVWTAWYGTRLYMYIEVEDSTPNHNDDGNFFHQDGVEININGTDNRVTVSAANHPNRNRTGQDEDATWRLWGVNVRDRADEAAIRENIEWFNGPLNGDYANGYVIEVAFNLAAMLLTPALEVGRSFTLEVIVNDNAQGFGRTAAITHIPVTVTLGEALALPEPVVEPVVVPVPDVVTVPGTAPTAPASVPVTNDTATVLFAAGAVAAIAVLVLIRKKKAA
jgi:hypothetical protein